MVREILADRSGPERAWRRESIRPSIRPSIRETREPTDSPEGRHLTLVLPRIFFFWRSLTGRAAGARSLRGRARELQSSRGRPFPLARVFRDFERARNSPARLAPPPESRGRPSRGARSVHTSRDSRGEPGAPFERAPWRGRRTSRRRRCCDFSPISRRSRRSLPTGAAPVRTATRTFSCGAPPSSVRTKPRGKVRAPLRPPFPKPPPHLPTVARPAPPSVPRVTRAVVAIAPHARWNTRRPPRAEPAPAPRVRARRVNATIARPPPPRPVSRRRVDEAIKRRVVTLNPSMAPAKNTAVWFVLFGFFRRRLPPLTLSNVFPFSSLSLLSQAASSLCA